MKTYNSFEDIELDLKRLSLERQIGIEQMKAVKNEFAEDLKPLNWVRTVANVAGKYGLFILLKRFFK